MSKSEAHPEFLGLHSTNSFIDHDSSPRAVMLFNHFSQRPGLVHYDSKLIKTGAEYEFGKYINDVRVDHDCIVRGIVPRYSFIHSIDNELHPEICLLVEYEKETKGVTKLVLDVIDCPNLRSSHTKFGFELYKTDKFKDLNIDDFLCKDTILCKTRSLNDDGSYMYGLNANMVLASHPGCSEDSAVISESFAKRIGIVVTEKRIINITKNTIPLNIYGSKSQYKVFPNIGEQVRPDGLLFSSRKKNEFFNPADINDDALMKTNHLFDEHTYVKPGSVIVDIKVIKGNYRKLEFPTAVTEQLEHYSRCMTMFYKALKDQVDSISLARKKMYSSSSSYELSPRLHQMLVESEFMVNCTDTKSRIKLVHKRLPIEEYRIEITTKKITMPNNGYKITDTHGGKSVICTVMPDADMPRDIAGNIADVMVDDSSTIARMNIGRLFESYLGAFCRDNYSRMLTQLYNKHFVSDTNVLISNLDGTDIQYILTYLHNLYSLISDEMLGFLTNLPPDLQHQHALEVIKGGITLYYPPDNSRPAVDVVNGIEKTIYKPVYGPITYKDGLGRQIITKGNIRVGFMYIMVLEKTADTYMGVSSAKLNNFGFPAKVSSANKNRTPHAHTPAKVLGETENRLLGCYLSAEAVAELNDSVSNPDTHKLVVKSTLESDTPMKIPDIDRNANPLGNSKALLILKHIAIGDGFDFMYVKETRNAQ